MSACRPPRPGPLPLLLLGALTALGCGVRCAPARRGAAPPAARAPAWSPAAVGWLKGQLHAHSNRSGDSQTPPAAVARWYAAHGYDFLVLTDHNRLAPVPDGPLLVIPGVELTAELARCEPPSAGTRCPLHVNALFVDPAREAAVPPRPASVQRVDIYGWWLDTARALDAVPVINHPNYEYGADADVLDELCRRGARLIEVANEAADSNNQGDATHPSTEALWDAVLTRGCTLYGVASDDAHHYDDVDAVADAGEAPHPGDLGFVMVRAARAPRAIREALLRGDFYASSGVLLARHEVRDGALEVEAAPSTTGTCEIRCIGTGGRVLQTITGHAARCALPTVSGNYVRAVVTDGGGRRAWTQPVRVP